MNPSITKSSARWFAVVVVVVTAAVAFVGFTALQVPGMGLDEGAHITHAEKLRQGHLASHDDMMSPELSSAIRCERYRAWGSGLNPGYPSGAHYECYSPAQLKKGNNEFAAQQAQHTPVYYLPLALATKVVDKVTDLDPLVDTYRVAGLIFTALTTASLLILARKLRISPWIGAACTLAVIGTSGFIYAHVRQQRRAGHSRRGRHVVSRPSSRSRSSLRLALVRCVFRRRPCQANVPRCSAGGDDLPAAGVADLRYAPHRRSTGRWRSASGGCEVPSAA